MNTGDSYSEPVTRSFSFHSIKAILYILEFQIQGKSTSLHRYVNSDTGCKTSLDFYSGFFSCKLGIIILPTQEQNEITAVQRQTRCLASSKHIVIINVTAIPKHDGKSHLLLLEFY